MHSSLRAERRAADRAGSLTVPNHNPTIENQGILSQRPPPASALALSHAHTQPTMLQQRRLFSSSVNERRDRRQPQASHPRTVSVWEALVLVVLLILTCINLYTFSDRRERVSSEKTRTPEPNPMLVASLFDWCAYCLACVVITFKICPVALCSL